MLQALAVSEQMAPALKALLLDESGFWQKVQSLINLLEPVVSATILFEGDSP